MSTTPKLVIACIALVAMAAACTDTIEVDIDVSGEVVEGSGVVTTETRDVSGFDEVVVFGSGDVSIDVAGTESLQLETDDNLVPLITTEVTGGRLELSVVPNTNLRPTKGIRYTITATELTAVTILGSADIEVTGLDSNSFAATINGSGNVTPHGTTGSLDVAVNGSGNFAGEDLVASIGEAASNGSGSILINATDGLTARVSGSGSIRYLGEPVLDESVSGSGSVSPR